MSERAVDLLNKQADAIVQLSAELAIAIEQLAAVRNIHSPSRPYPTQVDYWCAGCGHDYPCPTIRTLAAVAGHPAGQEVNDGA